MAKKTRVFKRNARKKKLTVKGGDGLFGFMKSSNQKRFDALKKLDLPGFSYTNYENFKTEIPNPEQQQRILRDFEMQRGNVVTGFGNSIARGINDTTGSMNRGFQRWRNTKNTGPFGYRGIGPQNQGGLTGFTRGLRRGITDLMGNRNAKTRKSSFTNISRINTNTVASIAAKIDSLLIHLGVPYLFTDNTYATNYIISRFNPGTQSNDGRGFLRLTEEQIRQIATYVDKSFGPTTSQYEETPFKKELLGKKMQEYQQKLEDLKQQITISMKTNSLTSGLGLGSFFGTGEGQPANQQQFNSLSSDDVSLLVQYMVVSTILSFMVDKLEKETGQGTFEIDPNKLSTMIEQQISKQISQINPGVKVVPVEEVGIELTKQPGFVNPLLAQQQEQQQQQLLQEEQQPLPPTT